MHETKVEQNTFQLMISPIRLLLSNAKFRRKVIHFLQNNFFSELNLSFPVANGYWARIHEKDAYDSFAEIFIKKEYSEFLPPEPPRKVLDIGANYGFFSLWLQSIYPQMPLSSTLVEPSLKCHSSLESLIKNDQFKGRFKLLKSCIGNPNKEYLDFFDRPFMASSITKDSNEENGRKVNILKPMELRKIMPPPWDLLKCDIEGSEWELFLHYKELLQESRYLLLEWHSWHGGGRGYSQIIESLKEINFTIINASEPQTATGRSGQVGLILCSNQKI